MHTHLPASFCDPLDIGSWRIPNRLILAPLAGVSDQPFRRICAELGAGLTFVEMLAANAVTYRNRRTEEMIKRHPEERRLGVQLSGPTVDAVRNAVEVLTQMDFDCLDLNMGCPVKKIVSKGWGSALLREPEHIFRMVQACRQVTDKPLSVKIRIGFTRDAVNVCEVATAIAEGGADGITIHGRTREDNYGEPVRLDAIEAGFSMVRSVNPDIVCVGNGDILDESRAQAMAQTGCDAVMISRGALGDPWIFRALLGGASRHVSPDDWLEVVLRHLEYHEAYYGAHPKAPMLFRKHLLWYITGFRLARRQRDEMANSTSFEEMRRRLEAFARSQPPGELRFQEQIHTRSESGFDPKWDMDRGLDRGIASSPEMVESG